MVNKVILLGNVGKDPDIRELQENVTVANFTLATNETYKNGQGEKIVQTEWHNVVVWNSLARVVGKYVAKGDKLYIEGKIKTRSYEAQDGSKKYVTEIFATVLQMLGSAPKGNESQKHSVPEYRESDIPPQVEEGGDLPF
jgi:single-strand DNA-binding protein